MYGEEEYYDYYYSSPKDVPPPEFISSPQSFTVEQGQSVEIPCKVKHQGNIV